jgi:hypothetical protein
MPMACASWGRSEVAVIPGNVFASRKYISLLTTKKSFLEYVLSPSSLWSSIEILAIFSESFFVIPIGGVISVAPPTLYFES